jgi:hypothetical protein
VFWVIAALWLLYWGVRMLLNWYRYHHDIWVITNQRIVDSLKTNPFSQRLATADLVNVQDMTVQRHGLLQTMLNYGNIVCETAAEGGQFISPHPERPRCAPLSTASGTASARRGDGRPPNAILGPQRRRPLRAPRIRARRLRGDAGMIASQAFRTAGYAVRSAPPPRERRSRTCPAGPPRRGGRLVTAVSASLGSFDPHTGIAVASAYFPRLYNVLVNQSATKPEFLYFDLAIVRVPTSRPDLPGSAGREGVAEQPWRRARSDGNDA